jgi:phospholipid/cholesterol/gamma-HCH transport system substrate-binding protein
MDQQEDNHYEPPGRSIAPYNKFPFIPPQADYDPGPPSVQLPPGVVPGPGPAPQAPFPLPVPPNDNGPPPPWPYYAPPDQIVPPYGRPAPPGAPVPPPPDPLPAEAPPPDAPPLPAEGAPQPQASGQTTTTYDSRTGVFADPAGGTGVFASGSNGVAAAETWVDLMMDPRQA